MPKISFATPANDLAKDFGRIIREILMISSKVMLPLCLMFFSFLRSRGGSIAIDHKEYDRRMVIAFPPFNARMTSELAEGTTETAA